ncbi:Ser-Thr-rich glycosyl-phosphatidyl-inositol-anchored membrane family-domain-containing protein [Pyronema domesticum]|uniref:Similar to Uncharacterized serine-rich protein C1E8.05 acc. no. O42970 n=1 Tax=Pyronema omphalodes (strain CBS 100304) TaxID=1076935 RepID=U4LSB7_PYROM|nr:Ser-Thr-rich glycosyl-phosphatidyl-inositol-anchored membrane family-domain-containing protein [Pyronema domesticum]CCX34484.1 Similar to Uncharacterized serine-rich protein C1E8.05; acc. no. O42970 [Pyronema omphalodes CBS 100304]
MQFSTAALFTAFASVVFAASSTENPITSPDGTKTIIAGEPFLIKWTPTTKGTITLKLRQGPSDNLNDVETIADSVVNSGSYEWTPASQLPSGDNYAIMITTDNKEDNYTPLIKIKGNGAVQSGSKSSSTEVASKTSSHAAHITTPAGHNSTLPGSNSTITSTQKYSNSTTLTKSSSKTATLSATASVSATPSAPASGAMGVVRSPIALVACLVAGVVFLN